MEPAKYNFFLGGFFGTSNFTGSGSPTSNSSQAPFPLQQTVQKICPGIPTFTRHVSVSSNFKMENGTRCDATASSSSQAVQCTTPSGVKDARPMGSRRPTSKLSLPLRTGSEPPLGRRRMLQAPVSIDLPTSQQPYTPSPSSCHSVQFSPEDIDRRYEEMLKKSGRLTIEPGGPVLTCQREDIHMEAELGQGICGVVSRARLRIGDNSSSSSSSSSSSKLMAVKVMRRTGNNAEEHKRVMMDLEVVTKCHDCRHIVRCFGVFIFPSEVWICMELMATCLDRLMRHAGPLPERILGKIVVPILKALHYLKDKHNIIHRDVKPSNMLLNDSGRVKLCDFGISGLLEDSRAKTRTAGCTAYLSPERITLAAPYDIRSDVWSLGISLVELACGRHPLGECATEMEMLTRIVDDPPPQLPPAGLFTDHFRDFVAKCLTKDVSLRPKYQRLLCHDFVRYHEQTQTDLAEWFAEVRARCPGLAAPPASTSCTPPSASPSVAASATVTAAAAAAAASSSSSSSAASAFRRHRQLSAGSQGSTRSSGYGSVDTVSPSSLQSRSPSAPKQQQQQQLHLQLHLHQPLPLPPPRSHWGGNSGSASASASASAAGHPYHNHGHWSPSGLSIFPPALAAAESPIQQPPSTAQPQSQLQPPQPDC